MSNHNSNAGAGKIRLISATMMPANLRKGHWSSVKSTLCQYQFHRAASLQPSLFRQIKISPPSPDLMRGSMTVAQIAAQAQIAAGQKAYRLVLIPRAQANKLAKRKDKEIIILGSNKLPANILRAKLLEVTSTIHVEGLEKLPPASTHSGSNHYAEVLDAKNLSKDKVLALVANLEKTIAHLQHTRDDLIKLVENALPAPSESEIQRKKADEQLLKYLKVEYKNNPTYRCGDMLNLLHEERWQGAKDQARFAWEIYHAKILNPMDGFSTFCAWYKEYCRIMGIEPKPDYKPSKLGENEASRQIRKYLPLPEKEKLFHVG